MIVKHIALAALAATFVTGGASLASAESGAGVAGTGSGFTSSALTGEQAAAQEAASASGLSTGAHAAYGSAREQHRSAKHSRTNGRMQHNN